MPAVTFDDLMPEGAEQDSPYLPVIEGLENSSGAAASYNRSNPGASMTADSVVSPKGAVGRFQILPATASQYGFDPAKLKDPAYNRMVANHIAGDLHQKFGDDPEAIAVGWNAGPGRAQKWLDSGRDDSVLPGETQGYVGRLRQPQRQASGAVTFDDLEPASQKVIQFGDMEDQAKKTGRDPESVSKFIDLANQMSAEEAAKLKNGDQGKKLSPSWWDTISAAPGVVWQSFKQDVAGIMRQVAEHPESFDQPDIPERAIRELGASMASPAQQKQELERRQAMAAEGKRMYDNAAAEIAAETPNLDNDTTKRIAFQLATGTMEMLPILGATLMSKNPAVGGVLMGAQADASKYGAARAAGRTPDQAAMDATFSGINNGVLGSLPLGVLMKPGQAFLGKTLKSAASFGAISVITEAVQLGYDKGLVTPDMSWPQAWPKLVESGVVGTLQGALLGGGPAALRAAVDRLHSSVKPAAPAQPPADNRVEPGPAAVPGQSAPQPSSSPPGPAAGQPSPLDPNNPAVRQAAATAQTSRELGPVEASVRQALGLERPGVAPTVPPEAVTPPQPPAPTPEVTQHPDLEPAFAAEVKRIEARQATIPKDSDHAAAILARSGGIRNDEGHDIIKGRGLQQFVPGVGPLVRDKGMSIDAAGEVLWNEGFWGNPDVTPRPTENQVLQLLERTRRDDDGKPTKVYAADRQAEIDAAAEGRRAEAHNEAARDDIRGYAKKFGHDLSPDEVEQVLADMGHHGIGPDVAVDEHLERLASQEVHHDHEETGRYPEAEDVPFGDEPAEPHRSAGPGVEGFDPAGGHEGVQGNPGPAVAPHPGDAGALNTERGAAGLDQTIIPGTEQSARQLAQSREDAGRGRMKPRAEQRDAGGMFEDKSQQTKDLFQTLDRRPFFSALTRSIEETKMTKAPAKDWMGVIENLKGKGVKQEEIDWSGVKDFLQGNSGTVTKAEVLEHLRGNEVQVQEVEKSDKRTAATGRTIFEDQADGTAGRSPAKYGSYTLPGGKDYRELLLTLPERAGRYEVRQAEGMWRIWNNDTKDWARRPDGKLLTGYHTENAAHSGMSVMGSGGNNFRSGHWDEPNVLAHIRFDDRTGPNGEKVLHVAEIQSDWHQAGRRKGYNTPLETTPVETGDPDNPFNGAPIITRQAGVPDAPFKSTWHELAMKRVMRYAAEHGYDRLSWDTGETNAERYDLSKKISSVLWFPKEDGYLAPHQNLLEAYDHDGRKVIEKTATAEQLPDLIGKEAADRLVKAESADSHRGRVKQLRGLDLKVGGEGMRGFYDRILPQFVNKYAKKWGAKVEQSKIGADKPTVRYEGERPTNEQLQAVSDAIHARPTDQRFVSPVTGKRLEYQINRASNERAFRDVMKEMERGKSFADAMAWAGSHDIAKIFGGEMVEDKTAATSPVHSIPITDAMRASVMQGQPLFQAGQERIARPAGRREQITPDVTAVHPDQPSPAEQRVIDEVTKIANRIVPDARVIAARRLEISEQAQRENGVGKAVAGAANRDGVRALIAWSLESPDASGTLRHEALHFLKDRLRPEEWATLEKAAQTGNWIGKHNVNTRWPNLPPEGKIEESIAEGYGTWKRAPNAVPQAVRPIFEKIARILAQVGAYLRRTFGRDATADDIFSRIESGEVGRRKPGQTPHDAGEKFDVPTEAAPGATFGARIKKLADGLFDLRDDFLMHVAPMAVGTPQARAVAKDFANAMRLARWHGGRMIDGLKKNFDHTQLKRMWEAADEESVLRQEGKPTDGRGLSTLPADERQAVQEQQVDAQNVWNAAKEAGMVEGEGLPSYVPRMMVEMAGGQIQRLGSSGDVRSIPGMGRNVRTSTPQMKHRKYLTTGETEGAASKKFETQAEVVKDIRTLPLATMRMREAVAGRSLINKIKEMGKATGEETVVEGHEPAGTPYKWFTINNPAFQTWRPRFLKNEETGKYEPMTDQNGEMVFEKVPIYVRGDFEGPLRAVLTGDNSRIYNGLMQLKGRAMTAIMYSPLIHNMVEWGRALPAVPGKVFFGVIYFEGNAAKKNPQIMSEAIMHGLVPIGHQAGFQDITSIANADSIAPGRSLTSKILAAVPGLFDRRAGDAVKRAIDKMGDFWHNTLLWDRIGDLQMGLYVNMRKGLIKKGQSPENASYIAAHFANRYAGALPMESMSNNARKLANLAMFSRTYTLGNLGAMKDMITGLPKDVQSQIERTGGIDQLKGVRSLAVRKAISVFLIDTALFYASNAAMQSALSYISGRKDLSDIERGYVDRALALSNRIKETPSDLLHIFDNIQSLSPTSENEPGRENRFFVGYDRDGTAIYGRATPGKIGEEYVNWLNSPIKTAISKMSTFLKPTYQTITNDAGFGRHVYDPNAKGFTGMVKNLGSIVQLYLSDQVPIDSLKSGYNLMAGKGTKLDAFKTIGPLAGVTFSKGATGGPALGELYNLRRENDAKMAAEMPAVIQKIKAGDIAGARADMKTLGIAPQLQNYYIRTTRNPQLKFNTRSNRQLLRNAAPEVRDRIERMRGEQ